MGHGVGTYDCVGRRDEARRLTEVISFGQIDHLISG